MVWKDYLRPQEKEELAKMDEAETANSIRRRKIRQRCWAELIRARKAKEQNPCGS